MSRIRWRSIIYLMLGLLAVVLIAAAIIVRLSLPEIIISQAEQNLKDVRVEISEAWYSFPRTIGIKGATLRRKADDSLIAEIKRADVTLDLKTKTIRTIVVKGINLKLREADMELFGARDREDAPNYSVWIRGATIELAGGKGELTAPKFIITDSNLSLEPEPHGLVKLNGTGRNEIFGDFNVTGLLGGKSFGNSLEITVEEAKIDDRMAEFLPGDGAQSWAKMKPSGNVTLRTSINWRPAGAEKESARPDVRWTLQLGNASILPPGFPNPFTNINASVEGDDKSFSVSNATANYGAMKVAFDSTGALQDGILRVLFSGRVRDFEPKPEFATFLTEEGRQAMDNLRINGVADADIDASLYYNPKAKPGEHTFDVDYLYADVNLRNASVNTKWFPYAVDGMSGSFILTLDELLITSPIIGTHGPGTVALSGKFKLSGKGAATDMLIDIKNLPADQDFFAGLEAMSPESKQTIADFNAKGGTISGSFSHHGSFTKDGGRWSVELNVAGLSASYQDFPYALSDIQGKIIIQPGKVTIENFSAWHGEGTVSASGWFKPFEKQDNIFLKIQGTNLLLDKDLSAALPKDLRDTWQDFHPIGKIDAEITLASPSVANEEKDVRVKAVLKDISASIPVGDKWVTLTGISGNVEHYGSFIRLSGIKARAAGGFINLDGTFIQAKDRWVINATVTGENQSLDQIIGFLPNQTAERLQQFGIAGKINIKYLDLDLISVKGKPLDMQYKGTIELTNAQLAIPMAEMAGEAGAEPTENVKWWNIPNRNADIAANLKAGSFKISQITGRMDIEDRGERGMIGSFHLDQMRIINGLVTNVAGTVRRTGAMFYIDDLNGEMYGGRISMAISGATDMLFFTANIRAFGFDVARFANETGVTKERVWGDLRASVHINGERVPAKNGTSTWRLSGMGSVNIDRANLGQTAIVKSIFDYRAFFTGDNATVESATLDFEVQPQRLLVDRLELRGPYVSTRAVGWINYRDNLAVDLYFYRKNRQGILPNIPVIELAGRALSWAIDSIQNQLVVVHVTGTLTKPEISPAVLKNISEQFRRFIILNIREEETTGGKREQQPTPEKR